MNHTDWDIINERKIDSVTAPGFAVTALLKPAPG